MTNPEIIAAVVSAIGIIGGAIAWGIRYVAKQIAEFIKELKPNGGNSLKDQVTRLDILQEKMSNRLDAVETKIDMIINAFNDYIKGKDS